MDRNHTYAGRRVPKYVVALLAEGVDRNQNWPFCCWPPRRVALLAEGVDRNFPEQVVDGGAEVALLAEGVDRNPRVLLKCAYTACRPPRGGRG